MKFSKRELKRKPRFLGVFLFAFRRDGRTDLNIPPKWSIKEGDGDRPWNPKEGEGR